MINHFPKVWILTDNTSENISQAVGAAEALKLPYIEKKIKFNYFSFLATFLKGKKNFNVNIKESDDILSARPDIVISAGKKLAIVSRYLKNLYPNIFTINCMKPNFNTNNFDLNILSEHENVNAVNNITKICGTLNKVNKYFLFNEKLKWENRFLNLKQKKISLFIGDGTSYSPYKVSHLKYLLSLANDFAIKENASLLITYNKKSEINITSLVKNHIGVSYYLSDDLEFNKDDNPNNGFLAIADIHICTADSITTCSEIASTGKPSFIFCAEEILQFKHKFFVKKFFKKNYAFPFNDQVLSLDLNNLKLNTLYEGERISSSLINEYQKFCAKIRTQRK